MKYLVLDGNSILNRAFYGIKMLSNKKGQMTNGIYGFLSTLQKLLVEVSPSAIAVAFDLPSPTFRHKLYDKYKANRKKMPEELASQIPILKELLVALGYKLISVEDYEADDILGTFAKYCENKNYECVLATGDRDSLQLVSKNVSVRIASTKFGKADSTFYDEYKIKEVYGITPSQLVDVKALQGDSSDNIPGVKGIGEKTALELIKKFGTIENIYENLETLDIKESIKNKLLSGKLSAFMSYNLGKINKQVPIEIKDQDYLPNKIDVDKAKRIMTELEFFSFMEKMNFNSSENENKPQKEEIKVILDKNISKVLEILKNEKFVAVDIEEEKAFGKNIFLFFKNEVHVTVGMDSSVIKEFLEKIFNFKDTEKVVYNLKNFSKLVDDLGIEIRKNFFDVTLASYILNPSAKKYDITSISREYGDFSCKFSGANLYPEYLNQVFLCYKLAPLLKEKLLNNGQNALLFDIEQPLAIVLGDMEKAGFPIDKEGLEIYGKELGAKIHEIESEIYDLVGFEFNINSPKQLGFVLFEKLGLPKGKKGKTGYSTSAAILEKLKGYHEIIDMILNYRTLTKLKSTYCDGMLKLVSKNGRIHSSFNQTETRTGRISSTEPNLQNIPVRTEIGRELRRFFKAKDGYTLIDADYSQIELRVLAHLSGDENMINAFKNDEDIHAITASQIFNVPVDMVNPKMRAAAKTVNFGIIYGMGAFSLAQDLKISRFEAQNYINKYLEHYSGIDAYMESVIKSAKELGFSETMFKRRRYVPELLSSNHNLRSFGERVARNTPIQGSAADIIKIAMINTYRALRSKKLNSKLILQVHDELIIEAPNDEALEAKEILKKEMENATSLNVPLKVHIASGETWFDAKD